MAIKFEKLGTILQDFVSSTNDIEAAALVSPDGLPIATHLPNGMDEEHLSAISAAVLSLGERIGVELSRGTLKNFYVEGNDGCVILTSCSEDAVLLVLANKSAQLGRLLLGIKRTITELKNVLTSSEDLVEDLKGFFAEDLVEDLKDFLSEDLSLQAELKNAAARLIAQELQVAQGSFTSRNSDYIPALNGKTIENANSHQEESGKGEPDLSAHLAQVRFSIDHVLEQEDVAQQAQVLTELTRRIRESVYNEDVLKTTVKEVRRALKADRVYCYRFNSDWSGIVVAESVAPGWPSCLKIKVTDTYFAESKDGVEQYKNGRVCINNDIYKEGLTDCHLKLLE